MRASEERLHDSAEIAELISAMARAIADGRQTGVPLGLVGIRSRGFPIAQRLSQALVSIIGNKVPVGAADITLYRDDIGTGRSWPVMRGTEIPFTVDGAEIVLVDDVLFSGRTARAAMNAVCDLGRPARVRLATLVDRGHREFPIQPDVVGLKLETTRRETIQVRIKPIDTQDEIVRIQSL